jgi:hypothetical protein
VPADRPRLLVLLLPEPLEAFEHRELAETLMRAGGVVAVDPPRTSYMRLARLPDVLSVPLAAKQARRLLKRLAGTPGAVAIFAPSQYLLARGLVAPDPACELWYAEPPPPDDERLGMLHDLAADRATVMFDPAGDVETLWPELDRLDIGR